MAETTPLSDDEARRARSAEMARRGRIGGLTKALRSTPGEKSEEMRRVVNARWERVRAEREAAGDPDPSSLYSRRPLPDRLMLAPFIEDVQRAHPDWEAEAIERRAVSEMRLYIARLEGKK
ncbi:hypothetical protein MT344_04075 [Clavibacter michiganensis subsp. phaseoli]|uniref:hypothetical protein n=1 Tax=Clavibacter phaseoli TaxID=1734031 RepID=UPI001FB1BF78|nr:hypothetical protein [Clavibacter phaseoli]MCJ1710360.1 hypothetical protein [Clavibacter phaseoli]